MRVLFLDIDGVLNTRAFVECAGWTPPLGSEHDAHILDPEAVALLNEIVEATGARVVITSSWRITYALDALGSMLERRSFRGKLLGVTPQRPGRQRAREIAQWLEENAHLEIEAFAIVDDDDEAGVEHATRFVKTTFEEGLTRDAAARLVALLTSPRDARDR